MIVCLILVKKDFESPSPPPISERPFHINFTGVKRNLVQRALPQTERE